MDWGAVSTKYNLLDKQSFSICDGSMWASLVIAKGSRDDKVDGAVIGVSNKEYIALSNREQSYQLKEVTSLFEAANKSAIIPSQKIYAFFPKDDLTAKENPNDSIFIREKYFQDVSLALKSLGHSGLSKPANIPLREAYLINEQIVTF